MRLVDATFVNNEVEPGWLILREDIPLGKHYRVDLDRIERLTMVNDELGKSIAVDCIYVPEGKPPGYIPLIALRIDADA